MDFQKMTQTLAAVAVLVKLAKQANTDRKISSQEWGNILANGVVPLLAIHGVNVALEPSTPLATEIRTDVTQVIARVGNIVPM